MIVVSAGTAVDLGPQPMGGTWSWTGPSGYTSSAREIDNIPLGNGANYYYATYTDSNGCSSTQTFEIAATKNCTAPITPYVWTQAHGWQNISSVVVSSGAVVDLGPQPHGGTWIWSGPNGFSSNAREIDNIPLTIGPNVYTATYIDASGCAGTQEFVATINTPTSASMNFTRAASAVASSPSNDTPNSLFIDSSGTFFLQNAYSQYDQAPADHVWDFYTGANAQASLKLSTANSQYNTQTLCTSQNPVYTQFYQGTRDSPGPGGYADGNFCDVIGIWVDPDTGYWYGIVHNEIYPNNPRIDALSYAISTDKGNTWSLQQPLFTSPYGVGDNNEYYYYYGDGDPRLIVDTASGYFYIYYFSRIMTPDGGGFGSHTWTHVARAPISQKMAPGSWQKYYSGGWSQTPGIDWTCDPVTQACGQGDVAASMESNVGADNDPVAHESMVWPVSAQSPNDLAGYGSSNIGGSVAWNVYLQKYLIQAVTPNRIVFYASDDLAGQQWTYAGNVPFANSGVWYTWTVDGGSLTSPSNLGRSFPFYCHVGCSTYDAEYVSITTSFNPGVALPTYYIGVNGTRSPTNTYIVEHSKGAPVSGAASNKWTFVPVGDGFFYVSQGKSYLQVDGGNGGRAWGAKVSLAAPMPSSTASSEQARQQWRFELITAIGGVVPSTPEYRLVNRYSGLALSFASNAFDSSQLSNVVTAPIRDWDASTNGPVPVWPTADQIVVFAPQ
ncbi:hypothetical protein GCM10007898_23150 [Dyella flagellata]|uniref:Exo-alpha-sialidase n=2 Tax=Dyella flagellata TaxID=1867833 RepID=A0ABQ5XAV7_9GAMM|nr:hypothetical protein GCM10007898_23150 [Dyella flagellata]